jgi:hypothetical protein
MLTPTLEVGDGAAVQFDAEIIKDEEGFHVYSIAIRIPLYLKIDVYM